MSIQYSPQGSTRSRIPEYIDFVSMELGGSIDLSKSCTFSRSERFQASIDATNKADVTVLPSTLSPRSCGFGYGHKQWSTVNFEDKRESPSPSNYDIRGNIAKSPHSKTFGRHQSEKVFLAHNKINLYAKDVPGPGQYEVRKEAGALQKKILIKGRVGSYFDVDKDVPGCTLYTPRYKFHESSRFKNVGFGGGSRSQLLLAHQLETPSPATYSTRSSKFLSPEKTKLPHLRKRSVGGSNKSTGIWKNLFEVPTNQGGIATKGRGDNNHAHVKKKRVMKRKMLKNLNPQTDGERGNGEELLTETEQTTASTSPKFSTKDGKKGF